MWLKSSLAAGFMLMLSLAFFFEPLRQRSLLGDRGQDRSSLRLMSWNIGYGDLESETRARTEDLAAVAQIILSNEPDAVALQELTGGDQLKVLLAHLKNRYRGYVCSFGNADRVAAVLVKDSGARFSDVPAGDRFAAAATFHLRQGIPEIVLVSAHADAFSASRRRRLAEDVVDWARSRSGNHSVIIAGDFNFEVSVNTKTNLFTDNAKHDSESYNYLLKYFRDLGRAAGETAISDRRIDYVFGPLEGASPRRAEVLRGTAIGRMDHWPLLVEIGF
ncbi:MAG: endonuclease/exonuclease/phosphatase family protein [Pyrinomonadaceae bacterium]|nr:endonuclease/exonuclease/phosphatase family protein [Pyrinomonadaceae bacterium]